jgi:hypothetical protein
MPKLTVYGCLCFADTGPVLRIVVFPRKTLTFVLTGVISANLSITFFANEVGRSPLNRRLLLSLCRSLSRLNQPASLDRAQSPISGGYDQSS